MSTTTRVDLAHTVRPVRTQMQRPRAVDDLDDTPTPVTARDLLALLVAPLGAILALVMAVLVIDAMPWQGGLLLGGIALTASGVVLGTRRV